MRPYQDEASARVLAAFERERSRIAIQLPTGAGKTVIFAHIILETIANGGRALVLVHTDELLAQAFAKLREVLPPSVSIGAVKAERNEVDTQVIVASVQTLARESRLAQLGDGFVLVVIDECHHAPAETYRRILTHLNILDSDPTRPCPQLLGVTATLDRGDGIGLDSVFEQVVYELPIVQMVDDGYLAEPKAIQVALKADYSNVSVRGGDLSASESGQVFTEADGPGHVAEAVQTFASDRKSLVFVPTVQAAHDTAAAIDALGITATAVDGGTPLEERRGILRAFAKGEIQALTNCAVLTEGYDEPSVTNVVIARPTKSRGLYTQMVGRGLRRHPGKDDCLIIDMKGVSSRHNLMGVPELFGLPLSVLQQAGGSVTGAIALQATAEAARHASGELIARTVDLFRRRAVHWVPTANGRFVLSTGPGMIVLRPNGDLWDAVYAPAQGQPEFLATAISLGYAQGISEDFARTLGARNLISKDAPWRLEPPTPKQLSKLRFLGIPVKHIRTKGEASDLISAAIMQEVA